MFLSIGRLRIYTPDAGPQTSWWSASTRKIIGRSWWFKIFKGYISVRGFRLCGIWIEWDVRKKSRSKRPNGK